LDELEDAGELAFDADELLGVTGIDMHFRINLHGTLLIR
jgi:hypothetical protein